MKISFFACLISLLLVSTAISAEKGKCIIVDTGQDKCYDNSREIKYPRPGKASFPLLQSQNSRTPELQNSRTLKLPNSP